MEDHEIVVGLMRIVVLAGDGHTNLFPFGITKGSLGAQPELFQFAPLMLYLFEDGLFVRGAKAAYAEAVGTRVVRIGSVMAEEAMEHIKTVVFHDNTMQVKRHGPLLLCCPAIAHALGLTNNRDTIELLLQREQEEPFIVQFQKDADVPAWFPWMTVEPETWCSMRDAEQAKPLWLQGGGLYWYTYLEERRVVYCQYNGVGNQEEPLVVVSQRLLDCIERNKVRALILDLRLNSGGDLTTHLPLLHSIIRCQKINKRGHFFALIGRHTFSAAQHFVGQLDTHTEVTFVGECNGSRPQFVGEGNGFDLPYSGLGVNVSNLFWQTTFAFDRRMWIAPHIRAAFTSQDYRTNRDPALEAACSAIEGEERGERRRRVGVTKGQLSSVLSLSANRACKKGRGLQRDSPVSRDRPSPRKGGRDTLRTRAHRTGLEVFRE